MLRRVFLCQAHRSRAVVSHEVEVLVGVRQVAFVNEQIFVPHSVGVSLAGSFLWLGFDCGSVQRRTGARPRVFATNTGLRRPGVALTLAARRLHGPSFCVAHVDLENCASEETL